MALSKPPARVGMLLLLSCAVVLTSFPSRLVSFSAGQAVAQNFVLPLRTRVEAFKGSSNWEEVNFQKSFSVRETAIVICDMWDKHWCQGATERVNGLARKMAPLIDQARARGIQIIHAPSDTMNFYKDTPWRKTMLEIPRATPPASKGLSDSPLPIDDADGGCDTPGDKQYKAWTCQHSAIQITGHDVVSDKGIEIYSLLQQRGIKNLFVMGVHTNMCVLNRTFAIKQMTNWGIACVLVRDLTDAMYNPQSRPYVSHEQGTELVIRHIEKYWCPTVLSQQLAEALRR